MWHAPIPHLLLPVASRPDVDSPGRSAAASPPHRRTFDCLPLPSITASPVLTFARHDAEDHTSARHTPAFHCCLACPFSHPTPPCHHRLVYRRLSVCCCRCCPWSPGPLHARPRRTPTELPIPTIALPTLDDRSMALPAELCRSPPKLPYRSVADLDTPY